MRCPSCRSYIPEGIPHQPDGSIPCPACQKPFSTTVSQADAPASVREVEETSAPSFAPYLTLKMKIAFGPAGSLLEPTLGSLSFGPEGFSVVLDHGKRWEKVFYRDISDLRTFDAEVRFDLRGVESRLSVYKATLPTWLGLHWFRKRSAMVLHELLEKAPRGLSSTEATSYRRRLE